MRSTKMLGLAALATLITMAFIGVSTASATTFCETPIAKGECPEGRRLLLPATITSTANLHFTISNDHESCPSTMELTVEKNLGVEAGLSGKVTSLSTPGVCEPGFCTTQKYINLPYKAEIHQTSEENGTPTLNGTLTLSNGGSGKPALQFSKCGVVERTQTCTYPAEEPFQFSFESEAGVFAQKQQRLVLESGGAFCPGEMQISAAYSIHEQNFEAQSVEPVLTDLSHKPLVECGLAMKGTLGGTISSLTYSSCGGGEALCRSGKALHLPYAAKYTSTGSGEGTLELSNGGSGEPEFEFQKCTFFNFECAYHAPTLVLSLNSYKLTAEQPMMRGSKCNFQTAFPTEALWSPSLIGGSTAPLYLASQP